MTLKYNFVVREVGEQLIAVAVGKDSVNFNGMVWMNESGAFIFNTLKEDTCTMRER